MPRTAIGTMALVLTFLWASHGFPAGDLWVDVPFVQQPKQLCGAACISMVMQYWAGPAVPSTDRSVWAVPQIAKSLYQPELKGILGREMERYFRDNGFQTFIIAATVMDLDHHLSKGRPLIVCLQPKRGAPYHYVVVVGLQNRGSLVLLNDPAAKKLSKMPREGFDRAWQATGNWTLLALPEDVRSRREN
ncbi:MAG: papain-like cysteine protease family protein [Acidobacteriota bacterium]